MLCTSSPLQVGPRWIPSSGQVCVPGTLPQEHTNLPQAQLVQVAHIDLLVVHFPPGQPLPLLRGGARRGSRRGWPLRVGGWAGAGRQAGGVSR